MGDPRRQRKKYSNPGHPWIKERIDSEKEILKQYGLKRKNEIWKMDSLFRKYLNRAKTIIALRTAQSEVEKKQLLERLNLLGLLKKESRIEDVLNLTLKDLMERRLQTLVVRKNLARSMLQAREFITHRHVAVGERKITTPSYLVSVNEENGIKMLKQINITNQPKQEAKEAK